MLCGGALYGTTIDAGSILRTLYDARQCTEHNQVNTLFLHVTYFITDKAFMSRAPLF